MTHIIFIDEYSWVDPRVLDALKSGVFTGRLGQLEAIRMVEPACMLTAPKPMRHGPRKRKDWMK